MEKYQYPAHPSHIGEHIKKRRFDLKLPACECQKLLGADKSTLTKWECGNHRPTRNHLARITRDADAPAAARAAVALTNCRVRLGGILRYYYGQAA